MMGYMMPVGKGIIYMPTPMSGSGGTLTPQEAGIILGVLILFCIIVFVFACRYGRK